MWLSFLTIEHGTNSSLSPVLPPFYFFFFLISVHPEEGSGSIKSVDGRFQLEPNRLSKSLAKKSSFQMISSHKKFTLEEILKATDYFSKKARIGEGGCSMVYKGELSDGTVVAVKRAKKVYQYIHNLDYLNKYEDGDIGKQLLI